MRHGITVPAEQVATLLDSPPLIFRAMEDREGWPDHVVAEAGGVCVVLAPIHCAPREDAKEEAFSFRVEGPALQALRGFFKAHPHAQVELYFGPDSFGETHLAFTAYYSPHGFDRLKVWQSGIFSLTVDWGSQDFWDQWVVDPHRGEVTYTGTVGESRLPPSWLDDILRS